MLTVLQEQADKARAVLDPEVFDYYDAGSGDQITRAESAAAWADYRLRPHPLRDVGTVDTASTAFGDPVATPIGIAPSAFQRLAHPDAERASAAAAGAAGALFVLSTRASLPITEVAAAATGPWWFQVYVMRDRELTLRVVEDAVRAGARALLLTGDTPYVGRKRQVRGTRIPMPDDHFLVNIAPHLRPGVRGRAAAAQDPSIGLETIEWLRREFGLPVLVKGVLRGDAATDCLAAGAAGVVVSNHGGRQLDRAVPSAHALAEVVDAVAGQAPVWVDGGLTCGLDVLTALALGAQGVLIGRPVLWALAAGGRPAVGEALDAMTDDLRHVMALAGVARLAEIDRNLLHLPT
jgi:4-hydroxymandelate oxidase